MKDDVLLKALDNLIKATEAKVEFEVEYELEKSRMIFSAEVREEGNQTQRDAKLTILLNEKGLYQKMSFLNMEAKKAYYEWATFKAIKENR